MSDTEGETLFKRFSDSMGLPCERVATASNSGEQRPDFVIESSSGRAIVVEVKQFDPTPTEADAIERMLRGEVVVTGGVPGARVREAIAKANGQIRALSKDTLPGILVLFNNVFGSRYHTDPYAILTAMRGLDVVPVHVPTDMNERPVFLPIRSGPKKKLTASDNTHVSAIGVLYETPDLALQLDLFHNRHALVPLTFGELGGSAVRHFVMREDEGEWEQGRIYGVSSDPFYRAGESRTNLRNY